jgi:hypothetical protein
MIGHERAAPAKEFRVSGLTIQAAGLLHRQGVLVSDSGENETGWESPGKGAGGVAADADRPGVAGVRHPWIPTHSPQAKGRVERGFLTAQDRLVKGMRVAGVKTLEQANHYLETEFLPWVNSTLAVAPANPDDAHGPLEKHHDLAAILSHVEQRRVNNDCTFPLDGKIYQIARKDVCTGLRGAFVRVEKRRDGSVAARFRDRYLSITQCAERPKVTSARPAKMRPQAKPVKRSAWNKNFDLKKAPKIWQAVQGSGARPEESL